MSPGWEVEFRVVRLGVISAYPDEDWDAQRIWEAAARRGEAVLLAPTDFAARIQAMAEVWRVWAEHTHVFPKPGGNPGGKAK